MRLSDLLKELYEASEFTSVSSLAEYTETNKGFIDRNFAGQNTMEKLDRVFEALTTNIEAEELITALEMIKRIKSNVRNQIL